MSFWRRKTERAEGDAQRDAVELWEALPRVSNPLDGLRLITAEDSLSWVLFEHGTYVVFSEPTAEVDLRAAAISIMREHGPVHVGSPAGDFSIGQYRAVQAYLVGFDHPQMATFVGPDEVASSEDTVIGLYGRSKRERDAAELTVVAVQDKR